MQNQGQGDAWLELWSWVSSRESSYGLAAGVVTALEGLEWSVRGVERSYDWGSIVVGDVRVDWKPVNFPVHMLDVECLGDRGLVRLGRVG